MRSEELALDIRNLAPILTELKPSPMRGRGTALAVDEVPTQAPDFVSSLSIALDSRITAKLSPALTRGAGESTVSVGSRCPRLKLCGGVNPSNPPLPAMGFAPPALVKRSTRPRSGWQRSARRILEVSRPTFAVSP